MDFRLCEEEAASRDIARAFAAEARAPHAARRHVARDGGIERLLRDRRVHRTLEGTSEIMRLAIARHVLEQGARV